MKKSLHLTHTDIFTDSRILKEMGALARAGYNVKGLGIELEEGATASMLDFEAEVHGIQLLSRQFKYLPRLVRHALSLCELFVKMLPRALKSKPDIVHCHDTLVLPLGVIVKLFCGSKLVYDAHELESDRNGISKTQGLITLWVEILLWRFVDALIVVSPSIQAWYSNNVGYKHSAVILNTPLFEIDQFVDKNYLQKLFAIPKDRLVFIYIGILGKGRGIDLLIEAFASPEIESHIVFLGFGEFSPRLEKLRDVNPKVHLHKSVPHAQVVPIAMSADFGLCLIEKVSLSDYLCLPNKLFEYCFAGIPVLASNFPDIKELVTSYSLGECCDLSVSGIINAIKRIESNRPSYFQSNLTPLTWQEQERILLTLYRQLDMA
jgi:glycosyltransferase involved in cell wall biosynthesis